MEAAINPNAGSFNLVLGPEAVAIPPHHPAYTSAPPPTRNPSLRRCAAAAMTIAGLLSVAVFAAGTAHYMLQITQPGRASVTAALAPAEAAPVIPLVTSAAEPAAASPSTSTTLATETTAESAMPVLSASEAATPVTQMQVHKTAKSAKLAARARRKKPLIEQAARIEVESLPVVELPARIFTPAAPFPPTPKASN
ncbi:MAG TPA: hypothetical protein VHT04_11865 [Stellaceae bacterium]|jgi:hypothetical protein|nr:hypothetical protein [Stellaceae bacterium]